MLQVQPTGSVPAETARIAHQVFPKGNRYLNADSHNFGRQSHQTSGSWPLLVIQMR
ncbi:hypothetical protein N836_34450 [Leptolyngbya sp. Heron Island J]|nr:hypothetical protein N836_34450 [Leptolyngbya sp. Heron Island J]